MNRDICAAIRDRAVVQFHYNGGLRTVEPHCHGVSKGGNELLRGYQTGGHSQSGQPVEWKLFSVGKISSLQQTGQKFSTNRPDYNPNDRAMKSICCRV
jgi:hypothetical protein